MEILATAGVCEEYWTGISPYVENKISGIGDVDAWLAIHGVVELYWK